MTDHSKRKIVVLGLTFPFRGGISHHSTLLVRELRKKFYVEFITLCRQYPKILFPGKTQYDHSANRIVEENNAIIDSINPLTWIKTALLLRKHKADLVIVQWFNPFFGFSFGTIANLLSLLSNTEICFLCHNVIPHESTILDRILSKYAFFRVKYFIVHSKEDEKNLLSFKPNAIVKRNVHPTYSVFSGFATYDKGEARKRLNLEQNKKVILFFGLVRPYKGLEYLVYAMKEVVKHIDCILLIVGEFYEPKENYLSLIKKLKLNEQVMIVDKYVKNEEVSLYFCSADVVVLPYVSATQSGIVQIAFGFKKPVITTDVGGLPEAVEQGKTGFIVKSKSPEDLSEAIVEYYHGDYENTFKEEIENRTNLFDWDKEIRSIEFFLKKQ